MQILKNPNFDFLKWRHHVVIASTIFIVIGLGVIFTRGINLGIDFAGGANVVVQFQQAPPLAELRSIIPDASIQQYGRADEQTLLLRLPQQDVEGDYAGEVVGRLHGEFNPEGDQKLDINFRGTDALAELLEAQTGLSTAQAYDLARRVIERRSELGLFTSFEQVRQVPGVTPEVTQFLENHTYIGAFNVLSQESVGPQIGRELQRKAGFAIILSTLAMGLYIVIRFDLRFGVAAILCLFHDIMIALSFLAIIRGELAIITIAAFLMIIGYSINDTVVVYDRVRENVRKLRGKGDFNAILNRSMNQTLSRTVLTTGTTATAVICLIIFGGEVINEFAWILLIGTIAGTYSTLFVVPTIVLAWDRLIAGKSESTEESRTSTMRSAGNHVKG
jgi:preprotein translocase subunit SecF